ncbi:MAG: four helix bundle protein [Fidelibacterota bacterium]
MGYNDFSEMPVWKKSFDILIDTYKITKTYPPEEKFGLVSDMRRSANSIAHNIAEGFGRFYPKEKNQFYRISRGSAYELISQYLVSIGLKYVVEEKTNHFIEQLKIIIEELDALMKTLSSMPKLRT